MMAFSIARPVFLFAGLALLAGCQSVPKVQVAADPVVDVSKFTTFYLNPIPTDSPMLDDDAKQLLQTLDEYIEDELVRKGYVKEDSKEKADFMLVPRGKSVANISVAGAQFGGADYWAAATPWGTSSVNENSNTIMVLCFTTTPEETLVWTGWGTQTQMQQGNNPAYFQEAAKLLYDIIMKFPARSGS